MARRLLIMDARAGDWTAAQKHMPEYQAGGGTRTDAADDTSANGRKEADHPDSRTATILRAHGGAFARPGRTT